MIRVLFVCLGNICRSPLAEAIFRHKIIESNLEKKVSCDSAGTADYHIGDLPDERTVEVARRHGVSVHHWGKQFKRTHLEEFDYLIAMDLSNYRDMVTEIGEEPEYLFLMRHFDDVDRDTDLADPYYGGRENFEQMFQVLNRSIDGFIKFLKTKHNLP